MAGFFCDDLDVQFQLQLNYIAKRKKCHLANLQFFDWNTFFQKNIFLEGRGVGKKIIFYYFANRMFLQMGVVVVILVHLL